MNTRLLRPLDWVLFVIWLVTMSWCARVSLRDQDEFIKNHRFISPKDSSKGNTLPICISEGQDK